MPLNLSLTGAELKQIIGEVRFNEIAEAYDLKNIMTDPNSANHDQMIALLIGVAVRAKPEDFSKENLLKLERLFPPAFSFSKFSDELSYGVIESQNKTRKRNPNLHETKLLAHTFPSLTINDKLKNDFAILSTRTIMKENFVERNDHKVIKQEIPDKSEINKFSSQLFIGYELAYANLNDGCCLSVIDNDGEERIFQVKRIVADRGLYCHALVPLSADQNGDRDIKILFRGTYDIDSAVMDLSARAPGSEVMEANRHQLLEAVNNIVEDVNQKNPKDKISLTIAGHSLGGSLSEGFTSEIHQAIYHTRPNNQKPLNRHTLIQKFVDHGLYNGNEAEQKKAATDVLNIIDKNITGMPKDGYPGLARLSQVNTMGVNSARLLSREARVADGFIFLNATDNHLKQEMRQFKAGGDVVSQASKRSIGAGLATADPASVSVSLLKKEKESNSLLRSIKAHMSYPFGTPNDQHLQFKFYNQDPKLQKDLCKELSHTNLAMRLLMKIWRQAHKTPIVKDVLEKVTTEAVPLIFGKKDQIKKSSSEKYNRDIHTKVGRSPPRKK